GVRSAAKGASSALAARPATLAIKRFVVASSGGENDFAESAGAQHGLVRGGGVRPRKLAAHNRVQRAVLESCDERHMHGGELGRSSVEQRHAENRRVARKRLTWVDL